MTGDTPGIVHPVMLGGGKPVFLPLKQRLDLQFVETRTFDNRAALLRYDRRK